MITKLHEQSEQLGNRHKVQILMQYQRLVLNRFGSLIRLQFNKKGTLTPRTAVTPSACMTPSVSTLFWPVKDYTPSRPHVAFATGATGAWPRENSSGKPAISVILASLVLRLQMIGLEPILE
jgi:hypothetical protein